MVCAGIVCCPQERAAKLLEQIDLSSFVVSFVRVIMNMSVDELLSRLEDKAARMGDRNASLVQVSGLLCSNAPHSVVMKLHTNRYCHMRYLVIGHLVILPFF